MDKLPPIPTPPAQRWREFRIQVLPLIVFVCVLLTIVFMWRNFVQPAGIVGEVEAVRANVISLHDGLLVELDVDRFAYVTNGQPLGRILNGDPAFLQASIAAVEAEMKVMRARIALDQQRNEQNYHGLRMDLLSQKIELAKAQATVFQASNEFRRSADLFFTNVLSASEYDLAKASLEVLQSEIAAREIFINELEQTLRKMESSASAAKDPIEEAIQAHVAQLQHELKPTVLKAPMDGVVSLVYRRPGEKVVRGEPLLTVTARDSDRIIAYLRQPLGVIPSTNDTVTVRTRTHKRRIGSAQVVRVGAQMELINPALLAADDNRMEVGLPIMINLPPGFRLVPGEYVDVSLAKH